MNDGRRPGDPRADRLRVRFAEAYGPCPLPIPVESIAEDLLGLALRSADLTVSGLLIVPRREIWVHRSDTHARRRFTIAHEIGHWICHRHGDPAVCHLDAGDAPERDPHEREANIFAAELLMPAAAVRRARADGGDATTLSAAFAVSAEAMAWRLFNLGLGDRPAQVATV